MTCFYVFKYSFDTYVEVVDENNKKIIERVNTHAVAVLPSEDCTVLLGGGATWVYFPVNNAVDSYLVDGEIHSYEGAEALEQAKEIQKLLVSNGTIAPDPRILKPPKGYSPLKLAR